MFMADFIYNSQNLKVIQMSINTKMNKEIVVYLYNLYYLTIKKNKILMHNLDKSQKYLFE